MVIRTPGGKVTTIDSREESPERDAARLVHRERRRRWPSTTPATAACPRACRARSPAGSARCAATAAGRFGGRCGRASRSPATASPSTPRSSRRPSRTSTGSTTSHPPPSSTSTTTAPRATWATRSVNRDLARTYRLIADRGARGLLPRRARRGDGRRRAGPADGAGCKPRLAARPDDREGREALRGARAPAHADRLPRARRLGHGPAVERRLDGGRGAQHPRGLSGSRRPRSNARASPVPRGLALRVRRPQRVPRRPRLLRRAAGGPALRRVRRRAPRADRRRSTRATQSRPRPATRVPYSSTTHLVVSDRHGTVVSYTFTIESTGRQRHRRPRLRVPAQQRADRLQLRRPRPPEPRPTATSARAAR